MQSSCICTRDPNTGEALDIAPTDATLLGSSGENWRGLVAEHHAYASLDTPEFSVSEHTIVIQRSGVATIELAVCGNRRSRAALPGDITLLPAGVPRLVRHGVREITCITLTSELLSCATEADASTTPELEVRQGLRDPNVLALAAALEAEAQAGYPSGHVYGEALGLALAAHLLGRYAARGFPRRASRPRGGMSPCSLRRVIEYIDAHLADELRLVDLARVAELSPHRFAHNFKRATGVAPYQFVIRRRIERAKPLLRDTRMTIADVTFSLGFGNPSRFTYLFRRETGTTPSRYRSAFR
jgi:AraC family transcriptional regulator